MQACIILCVCLSVSINAGVCTATKQTNHLYNTFFQGCFDHYGTVLPLPVCVLRCSALISARAWQLPEWQVVRDSRAIPTFATKWSAS